MAQIVFPGTDNYSMAELMAVIMARGLAANDGQIGGVGAAATIPMAAVRLATLTVAPNLYWFCGSSGGYNPTFDHLPMTAADPRAFFGAEATQTMQDIVDMGGRGDSLGKGWGFGFSGGMQIDKYGNSNLIGIGPYEKLKVRGPGSVGLPWCSRIASAYLFTWHHSAQIFVEKLDHLSGLGWAEGDETRYERTKNRISGPPCLYSPICVMDFDDPSRAMRLRSVHPGYSVADVISNTGFELIIPDHVPQTEAPTEQELFILRNFVDRGGVLRQFKLTVG